MTMAWQWDGNGHEMKSQWNDNGMAQKMGMKGQWT